MAAIAAAEIVRHIDPRVLRSGAAALEAEELLFSALDSETGMLHMLTSHGTLDDKPYLLSDFPLTERALFEQRPLQMLAGAPDADPAEVELLERGGYRSLLLIPVVSRGETLGLLEAYRSAETRWGSREVDRAEMLAGQLGALLSRLHRS